MKETKKLVISALFLALGLVLPFLTGQIQEIGNALLPMHLPVFICGFVCGWPYALLIGLLTPLLRSFIFGMPLFIKAVSMSFELATYGAVSGLLYYKLRVSKIIKTYISLIVAMILGRIIWGIASIVIYGFQDSAFSWQIFLNGALLTAIPGIVLQLVLIPLLILTLEKSGVMDYEPK